MEKDSKEVKEPEIDGKYIIIKEIGDSSFNSLYLVKEKDSQKKYVADIS